MSSAISTPFGELPENWEYHEVKDHTEFLTGPAFDSNFFNTDGKGARLIRGINLTKGATRWDAEKTKFWDQDLDFFSKYLLKQNDILIGMDGSLVGHNYAYLKKSDLPALLVQRVARLRTNENIDSKFLYYLFGTEAWLSYVEIVKTNSGIPHISNGDIKSFVIPYPPLPEQQKIAAILSSVDDVIEKTRAQIDKLKDLKTGMMQELLTKGIGSGGVPHTEFKDSPVGRIPVSWDVYSLTELSSFRRGSFPQPYGLPEWYSETGHPFVQVYDIGNNGRLKPSTKVRISDAAASKSVFVPKGSVAVSIQGSIGRVAITQYDAFFDRTILIFTKLNKNVDREYFALMIGEIFRVKKDSADGGVIKTITKETLKDFLLKLPPIDEQRTISKTLGEIDSNARLKEAKLNKLQTVKKSLMQDLLTGKVRVKVDQKESAVS